MNRYLERLGTIDGWTSIGLVKMSKYRPRQRWSNLTCHLKFPIKKGQF